MKEKDNKKIIILVLILLVLGLSTIYAALSTRLNVSGQATIGNAYWDVHFDDETLKEQIKIGKVETTNVDLTATTFKLDVALEAPGDTVVYTFDVVNGGTIDAEVSAIIFPDLVDSYINYEFTYSDGSKINKGDILKAGKERGQGEKRSLKLSISYEDINADELNSSEGQIYDLSASILYVQAKNN